MFVGKHFRTIDSKGRIFIPAKFRRDLEDGVVLSRGFHEKCLYMYSTEGWKSITEKIKSKKVSEIDVEEFDTWISASASEESLDQQGRVRIPQNLLELAGLKKDIVIVGGTDKSKIWDKEIWLKYYEKIDSKFSDGNAVRKLDI